MPAPGPTPRSLPALALVALSVAVFDGACHTAQAQAPAPATTTAAPATTTAAPATTTASSAAPLHPVGVIASATRASIISSKLGGTIGLDPATTYWTPAGLERVYNGGVTWMGADGSRYWSVGTQAAGAQSLADLLKLAGGVGSWVEATDRGRGRFLTFGTIAGQQLRAGMLDGAPTGSIVLMVPTAAPRGTESRRLALSHGFKKGADGKPSHEVPEGATALPVQPPAKEEQAAWLTELASLRGEKPTLTWSTTLDLDRDGQAEGALCVTGGKHDYDCYVVDTEGGRRRWYGLEGMKFAGAAAGQPPLAFQHGEGFYLMQALPERSAVLQARWTGTEYVAQSVQ